MSSWTGHIRKFEADELAALAHLVGEAFADRSKKEER